MSTFSDRVGATMPPPLQVDTLSDELRTALWNVLVDCVLPFGSEGELPDYPRWERRAAMVFRGLHLTADDAGDYYDTRDEVKARFFNTKQAWYEPYNFIEYCLENALSVCPDHRCAQRLIPALNDALKKYNSAYRVLDGVLAPITNDAEMQAVQEAATSLGDRFSGARAHISTAVRLLTQRPEPDYRNSIKESISAVEAAARGITGSDKAMLPDALKVLERTTSLHPALRDAFIKLYGYTSDADGIRHSLVEHTSNAGLDEAKFMLVACSAFVNYLATRT